MRIRQRSARLLSSISTSEVQNSSFDFGRATVLERFSLAPAFHDMLRSMQHPATPLPASGAPAFPGPTFANLLASFAVPAQRRTPVRDLDGLEEDVATLSYERALRVHARYRAPVVNDRSLTQAPDLESLRIFEVLAANVEPMVQETSEEPLTLSNEIAPAVEEAVAQRESSSTLDRNLKSASITIRLSKPECEQLRKRAEEAGLTVSAYMRSCTFEAETLRAMVKDTLAQLRSKSSRENQEGDTSGTRTWRQRMTWFWPRKPDHPGIASA